MIGRIIRVSTSPAVNMLIPVGEAGPNSGMKPSALCSPGSSLSMNGASTTRPQKP